MYIKNQVFLVLGISKSGKAAVEFLLARGATVYIYDDLKSDRVEQLAADLVAHGAKKIGKEDLLNMPELCDGLVVSPGIPIDHPLAVAFKRSGRAVLGETELAARFMRCPIVAVTGTNGKTTTVSMLTETLQKGGLGAFSCGNIGTPMVEYVDASNQEVAVAEISSFQLETLNSLQPHVAVVLNITEDHLNRHYTMENYIFLKAKLLKNLSAAEYAVLNYDDEVVRGFAEKTKAQVVYFSVKERVRGAFVEQGELYFGKEKIISISELPVDGVHYVQNVLAVIAVAKIFGVKTQDIIAALTGFKGVKHRIEFVGEARGIQFVNDSKGTNVDATLKAIAMMKRDTILLLGGQNKGYDYGKLFSVLAGTKIVHAVLYGENRFSLLKSAREYNFLKVTLCERFDVAFQIAAMLAKSGQTVLLSPASASFDEFSGYEERGDRFVEFVRAIQMENERESQEKAGDVCVEADSLETRECVKPSCESENRLGELE